MDDVTKWPNLPVEVSEDKQTITVKSFDFEGDTYYPNVFTNSMWGMEVYNTVIVSEVVLTESDFAVLPNIVNEGRRVVNNIERVASMYLIKTVYSFLISLL